VQGKMVITGPATVPQAQVLFPLAVLPYLQVLILMRSGFCQPTVISTLFRTAETILTAINQSRPGCNDRQLLIPVSNLAAMTPHGRSYQSGVTFHSLSSATPIGSVHSRTHPQS